MSVNIMQAQIKGKNGFTLIEIMLTIIILGVIAAFGIPNYSKSVNRAKERDAAYNLELIREATNLYMARRTSPPPALANASAINTTLNLHIIEQQGNTYNCVVSNIYTCFASSTDGWQLSFRLDTNNGAVFCSAGACPSL